MRPELSLIQPVILAGGAGRRLWPLSTPARPKPFLPLGGGGRTLLQATAARARMMKPPVVVAGAAHRAMILRDLERAGVTPGRLLLEPCGRGTGAALAAAAHLCGHAGDALLLVLPSDHYIADEDGLLDAVRAGIPHAADGAAVTFGMQAVRAETRYGYIKSGAGLDGRAARIDSFVEKPPAARARDFLRAGGYYWNSGIFLIGARAALAMLPAAVSDAAGQAVRRAQARQEAVLLDEESWRQSPGVSIDRGIMERTARGVVIPAAIGWADIGTWPALLGHVARLGRRWPPGAGNSKY